MWHADVGSQTQICILSKLAHGEFNNTKTTKPCRSMSYTAVRSCLTRCTCWSSRQSSSWKPLRRFFQETKTIIYRHENPAYHWRGSLRDADQPQRVGPARSNAIGQGLRSFRQSQGSSRQVGQWLLERRNPVQGRSWDGWKDQTLEQPRWIS